MKNINYKIQFFSEWHCGSGLAAGADVDALVIKDKNSLPYIPGKTIKGLVREAVEDILSFKEKKEEKEAVFRRSFGYSENIEKEIKQGCSFFTNATLSKDLQIKIIDKKITKYLFRARSSTAIDNNGIACAHSLRRLQTTVPCELEGEILDVPDELIEDIEAGLLYIKRLGYNRNRGLGRCQFSVITEGGNQ